jgi:Arc/MetJ-type ribon-helix-helix transcriptional regulator
MADTEKVSFNITVVDLGKIDLLVEQGHYASRTDFLVASVRTQLLTHTVTMQELFRLQSPVIGATIYGKKSLEKLVATGKQLDVNVVGMCMFTKDVTPELALAAVHSLKVRGSLRASTEVKEALRERMV